MPVQGLRGTAPEMTSNHADAYSERPYQSVPTKAKRSDHGLVRCPGNPRMTGNAKTVYPANRAPKLWHDRRRYGTADGGRLCTLPLKLSEYPLQYIHVQL